MAESLIATNIEQYLHQHENKDMLRFLTCGSVDDGKSTLIGRLLYDSKTVFEDQLLAVEKDSKRFNSSGQEFDLSLLVDGLQSEREQGITIDVAYRYFTTDQRKFIIADTPGHEQYTRNMVTGASNCELAVILIDARYGVQVQTRRHSYICSLLGIKHIIVAVNKMDMVDHSQSVYKEIKRVFRDFAKDLNFTDLRFVPISALHGDNVVNPSENMPWYPGATLIKLLNTVNIESEASALLRFPVQYVNRANLDFRGFCGTLASGDLRVGDKVAVLPSSKRSQVKSIQTFDGALEKASQGMAVTLTLEDEIDVSRGDMLVRPNEFAFIGQRLSADIVWMTEAPLHLDREYMVKFGCKSVFGSVTGISYKTDVNSMQRLPAKQLELNEIGQCQLALNEAVQFDRYQDSRLTGAFILVDRLSNITVGAGMVTELLDTEQTEQKPSVSEFERELNQLVRKHFPHWQALKV